MSFPLRAAYTWKLALMGVGGGTIDIAGLKIGAFV
jgi:hypothetical protein